MGKDVADCMLTPDNVRLARLKEKTIGRDLKASGDAWRAIRRTIGLVGTCGSLTACSGIQSALAPAGEEARQVAIIFWVMAVGGLIIWAFVVVLSLYASRWKHRPISAEAAARLIPWAGGVLPVTVLTALLVYALWLMPSLRPFIGPEKAEFHIEVVGSQFWWHVVYHRPDGTKVISANEIRLPVGERVEFSLTSADMIHSFWIPALGGKMDMIPGRTNRLSLLATKVGTYRGQCAEFCGTSHARMAFPAIAMEPDDFDSWLATRSRPSGGLGANEAGRNLFEREGCGGCHRVDGTQAQSGGGPDLSHVGSRLTIGAGLWDNNVETLSRFIVHPASIKGGSRMPAYTHLSAAELTQIAAWLRGLQ